MEELNIRHFKLSNGEEIIALVAVKNDDSFIIESPVVVHNNFLGGFQFTKWFPFSQSKSFKILKNDIIQHVSIDEEAKGAYVQFALKMNKIKPPQYKSDVDIVRELMEEEFEDPYSQPVSESKGKTIH